MGGYNSNKIKHDGTLEKTMMHAETLIDKILDHFSHEGKKVESDHFDGASKTIILTNFPANLNAVKIVPNF
jgi:CYTH domain-containing protein